MATDAYRGIFTIPSTPFHPTGEVDAEGFRRIVSFCVGCGAHGLVYPVNASEFTTLSDAERMHLSQVMVQENNHRIPAVIGVAGLSREHAAAFAGHARSIGADAVIAMPPYVKRGRLPDDVLFYYYKSISDAARMPVFIQNYVPPVGTDMSAAFLLRLCREIEWVSYIKEDTVPSTVMLSSMVAGNDGSCLGVFGGAGGRYLIEEHRRGSDGNMPGCHVTDVVVAFWNALEAGDATEGMRIYKELAPVFFFEAQLPGTYKEVLKRRGVIEYAGTRNGSMPMDQVASDYLDEILHDLAPLMSWDSGKSGS
ncbi:MAG: dihydrodipicolinate synthase family protein [Spirochaetales bacterium]|nr:MAG: dihydrodipicolinate synthase family protein [Spirochaetales bacterium]